MQHLPDDWQQRLMAPLPKDEIRLRVGRVTPKGQQAPYSDGTKAEFLAYHDARHVMDRLDEVVGPERWQDEYSMEGNGAVRCRLSILLTMPGGRDEWVYKEDVGYPNNPSKPEPEALKSAYSDALKRTGVKWGIGRYLYSLPQSGWWPVNKWGDLSPADEKRLRARMFDGLEVGPPADDAEQASDSAAPDSAAPAPSANGMTDKQRGLIMSLAKEKGLDDDDYAGLKGLVLMVTNQTSMKDLTSKEASRVIERLQAHWSPRA